jgi:hypothetical protein
MSSESAMLEITESLQDIVNNIQINYDNFQITHTRLSSKTSSKSNILQFKKIPFKNQLSYFNFHILNILYQIYFQGLFVDKSNQVIKTNEQILQNIDANSIDWEFYEQLDINNKGKFWLHPSFHIVKQEIDGSLIAEFDNGFLQLRRDRHLPSAFQAATIGDAVAIKIPSSFIDKSYYMAIGNSMGGFPSKKSYRYTILIHFNFNCEAAVFAMNYLTTELNKLEIMFRFKVLHNPLNYRLNNSGILQIFSYEYNSDLYKEAILPVLQKIYTENKEHFNSKIPIFNKKLAPGIGLAERPHSGIKFKHTLDSEVSYCEFVANALLEAHQNGDESPEARMQYIYQHFDRLGIDLERSYLNPGYEDVYTPLNLSDDTEETRTFNECQIS